LDGRYTRFQGAIVRDRHILLLQQTEHSTNRSYWLLPGGRREPGETEQRCVEREMLEEVGLHVRVDKLLLSERIASATINQRKTYLCSIGAGEPRPGFEPEEAYAAEYSFTDVQWVDLERPVTWAADVVADQGPLLREIREALRRESGGSDSDRTAG
jgi:8-oxo-dGTP pyrophosphatase MutT (NUDIX family)